MLSYNNNGKKYETRCLSVKKIKTCRNSDILVLLMAVGIILVLLAYRIFSFLCDAGTFVWWMVPLGLLMAVMAAGGFLTAYQSWKRLQYLRDHPEER